MTRLLVTGASGFVGAYVASIAAGRCELLAPTRVELTPERIETFAPDAVIHLAAMTSLDQCQRFPSEAEAANVRLSQRVAEAAAPSARAFLYVSTDLVFDGARGMYSESDEPRPSSVYGASKLASERAVREVLGERAMSVRLALVYGVSFFESARRSFAETMVRRAREGMPTTLFTDEFRSPIYVEDAARCLVELASRDVATPVLHLGGPGRCSRHAMGVAALEAMGLPAELARAGSASEAETLAPRPRDVSFDTRLAQSMGLTPGGVRKGFERFRDRMSIHPGS